MKIKKTYRLSEECIEIIERKAEEEALSETAVLENIIKQSAELNHDDVLVEKILKAYDEKYKDLHTRLRLGLRNTDINSQILLDAVNLLISHFKIRETTLIAYNKMPIIAASEKAIREKIEYFKQRKDNKV